MLDIARDWLDDLNISGRPRLLLLAAHDCRMIYFLLGKGKETLEHVQYTDAASAFQVFVNELQKATGSLIDNPFVSARRVTSKKPDQ
eukprot:3440508-Pyramimonas_sp.AAC.1